MSKAFFLLAGLLLLGCVVNAPITVSDQLAATPVETAAAQRPALPAKPSYVEFNNALYQQARSKGMVVYLEFSSDWCTTCRTQKYLIEKAFSKITDPSVIGFLVHFDDGQTTEEHRALAREFGVFTRHTHVILDRQGRVAYRSNEVWNSTLAYDAITGVAGKEK